MLGMVAAAIVANTLIWTWRLWTPLPFWDQWDTLADYAAYKADGPSWAMLFKQHMEHRLVFPRLLFLADLELFGGRNLLLIPLIMLIQGVTTLILLKAGGAVQQANRALTVAVGASVTALMFSLTQHENFRWGFQVQFVGVYACAVASYALIHASAAREARGERYALPLTAAILLLVVGVFTMANGVVAAWLSLALALSLNLGKRSLIALAVTVAAATALYFVGYQHGPSGTVSSLAADPVRAVQFVLSYLGNIAWEVWRGEERRLICLCVGALGVGLTGVATIRMLLGRDRGSVRLVYLAVIILVSSSAVLTAAGRMSFGVEQAFASRYMTPVAIYWSCQLLYWASVSRKHGRWTAPVWCGAAIVIVAMGAAQRHVKASIFEQIAAMHLASDALLVRVNDTYALERAYPRPNVIAEVAPFMRREHLSIFTSNEAEWVGQALTKVARPSEASRCAGAFDVIRRPPQNLGDVVQVAGWAWDRADRRPAKRVLLINDDGIVAGIATVGIPRPDVTEALSFVHTLTTGWRGYAHAADGVALRPYVILADGSACPVADSKAAPLGPRPALKPYAGGVDRPLAAKVELQNSFGPDAPPFEIAAPVPPNAFTSWMGSDSATGAIRFGPFTSRTGRISFKIVTGPDTSGARIDVLDAVTQEVLQAYAPPVIAAWRPVVIDVEPDRPLVLRAQDYGAGWGEWIGITAPHEVEVVLERSPGPTSNLGKIAAKP